MNIVKKIVAMGLLASLLTGCETDPFVTTIINCPAVAIVSNTGTVTRFKGEERNTDDVAYNATISGVKSVCHQEGNIRFDVTFNVRASKGPQFEGDSITLPYFVVLMRDNHLITAKRVFETTIHFDRGAQRGSTSESLVQIFDDIDIARRYDYELLIGFQLPAEDVAYNALR